jgi:ubiquinone/menaquinone biosynthesis C-methylase UbiE
MSPILAVLLVILGGVGLIALARYVVRRTGHPCPPWFVPLLDSPLAQRVTGAALLLDRAGVVPGMAVLDVGCGEGRIAIPAAERVGQGGRLVALDLQEGMLHRLRQRMAGRDLPQLETLRAGAGEGALEPGAFDRVMMVTVLGEIPDRAVALREIHAALKPGGILSITEMLLDPHYQRPRTLRALVQSAGFRIEATYGNFFAYTLNCVKSDAD